MGLASYALAEDEYAKEKYERALTLIQKALSNLSSNTPDFIKAKDLERRIKFDKEKQEKSLKRG